MIVTNLFNCTCSFENSQIIGAFYSLEIEEIKFENERLIIKPFIPKILRNEPDCYIKLGIIINENMEIPQAYFKNMKISPRDRRKQILSKYLHKLS